MKSLFNNHLPFWLTLYVLLNMGRVAVAQPATLRGQVLDFNTHKPLNGANVYLVQLGVGTTTDSTGWFFLPLPHLQRTDTLVIQFVGYQTQRLPLENLTFPLRVLLLPVALSMDEVSVQGQRASWIQRDLGVPRQVLEFREIENYGTQEIADVFKMIPAVRVVGNDLDGRQVEIRGSNASEVNVYVDGILINQLGGNFAADLTIIPLETIARLEILKGSNLTLSGSGAFGGVVNITTHRPGRTRAMLKLRAGSFANRYAFASVQVPLNRKLFVDYHAMYQQFRPPIEYFPEEREAILDTSRTISTKKQVHMLNGYAFWGENEWRIKLWNYQLNYTKRGWQQRTSNWIAAGAFRGSVGSISDWDILITGQWNTHRIRRKTTPHNFVNATLQGQQVLVRVQKGMPLGKQNTIQLFAEYGHDELTLTETLSTPTQNIPVQQVRLWDNRVALATVWQFVNWVNGDSSKEWLTHLGSRYDYQASTGGYVTTQMGIQYHIRKGRWQWRPYFNFGKNIQLPYLMDNALAQYVQQTASDFEPLEAVVNNGIDGGIELVYHPSPSWFRRWTLEFSLYKNLTVNQWIRQPGGGAGVYFQRGRNITRGVEITTRLTDVGGWWSFQAGFTGLRISDPGLYPYKPQTRTFVEVRWRPWHGFFGSLVAYAEGKSTAWFVDYAGELHTATLSAFRDGDVVVGWRGRLGSTQVTAQMAAYNIFDAAGFQQYLLRKRYVLVSLSIQYH